eukprot:TRINITY_DN1772_c0_g1_i1.p1 TRINITY_DN1772_c0_g1~~TRINITY_DN1772_c0_g1_i1.p1  ORF type:complete len:410 (-),score=105.60 TRINITY_DN1772_c0_g1_i1:5-1234(-)
MDYIAHPDEVVAMLKLKYARASAPDLTVDPSLSEDLRYCYDMLNKTSRSFAFVIQELSTPLRNVVCIFYLTLRALDTIEDDMAIQVEKKVPLLVQFHEKLYQPGWNYSCGEKDEKTLIENFDRVISVFQTLDKKYKDIIKDITRKMGQGMAEFCQRPVVTLHDYNLYCHYVAGLVGIGLSKLFAQSGLESDWFATADDSSNEMGLFLQKTNITRDYLEDICQSPPRIFWPSDVWSKYTNKLDSFKNIESANKAIACLNDLITDALQHAPSSLDYMSRLRDKNIFNFCAIPQVMAIATLAKCYNNYDVFTGVVKIRRGQTAKIMLDIWARGHEAVYDNFLTFTNELANKIDPSDPNSARTKVLVEQVRRICVAHVKPQAAFGVGDVVAVASMAASTAYLVSRHSRLFAKL